MKPLLLAVVLCCFGVGGASTQTATLVPAPVPPVPVGQLTYKELSAYLNLTDAQLQTLTENLANRSAAQQAIYQQISAKQAQLSALLLQGTSDALTVGQLEIDINNLRRQLPLPNSSFRDAALAVLTPDQKTKLAGLVGALLLQQPASQAITLDLIDAPAPGPAPVPPKTGLLEMGAPAYVR